MTSPSSYVRPTFEQLYTSVRRWLPAELRRLGVRVDAEDLLHDVLIIAYARLEHFDPSKASEPARAFRQWIVTIACYHVSKRQRRALRHPTEQLGSVMGAERADPIEQGPTGEDLVAAAERRGILLGVLAKLKPARAEVLMMHTVLEMSAPDIARDLGVNENTVKSRLSRARCDALRAIERLPREHRSALEDLDEGHRRDRARAVDQGAGEPFEGIPARADAPGEQSPSDGAA